MKESNSSSSTENAKVQESQAPREIQGSLWETGDMPMFSTAMCANKEIAPPLKWHGGKHYLADWIISYMPPHDHYFEPFFGSGAVLFRKDPFGVNEIICDKCQQLMNFWATLQSERAFEQFIRIVTAVPFSEQQYANAVSKTNHPLDQERNYAADPDASLAVAFFIVCRQSMAGRMDCFAPASTARLRRGMNEQASAWMGCVEGLPEAACRLKRVYVHKPQSAAPLISKYDKPGLLMYLDPPYLHTERTAPNVYQHEMSMDDHKDLLDAVTALRQAKVLLSAYPNKLYDQQLKSWVRATKIIDNKASTKRNKQLKTEALYMNH